MEHTTLRQVASDQTARLREERIEEEGIRFRTAMQEETTSLFEDHKRWLSTVRDGDPETAPPLVKRQRGLVD